MDITKVTQRLRRFARFAREDGLINTSDLLVATAATVVLASAVGGAAVSVMNEANYGKAQPDAQTIAQAITSFYKDTGKWPGQVEQAASPSTLQLLATSTTSATYPMVAAGGLAFTGGATCEPNSLEGLVSQNVSDLTFATSTAATAIPSTGVTVRDLNSYLVDKPLDTGYTNWKGPYLANKITTDPWGHAWVAYLLPLYCSESTATHTLGNAWLLSGGTNGTITTNATDGVLDPVGDDAGIALGKLTAGS